VTLARIGSLAALGLMLSPTALAGDAPPEYDCVLSGNGKTLTLPMRLAPGHVSALFTDRWSHNLCDEPNSACSLDAEGRIRADGEGKLTSIIGSLLFDPASGALSANLAHSGGSVSVTGACRRIDGDHAGSAS
jgi:hypothetical protein